MAFVSALCAVVAVVSTTAASQDRRLARPDGSAERRLALVVGNDKYAAAPLANAVNDARAVATTLRQLAFDVDVVENASAEAFARAVDRLVGRVQAGDAVLFYYSGHGVQVDGLNYLIPVDFQGGDPVALKFRAVSVGEIDERLERRGARLRVVVLDACRDNPYRGSRAAGGGLASYTAEGALIAYATGPGATASDNQGSGSNGLFTTYFLEALRKPGLTVSDVFRWVRLQVRDKSSGRQVPWVHDGLIGEFVLNAGTAAVAPVTAAPAPPAAAPPVDPGRSGVVFESPAGIVLYHVRSDQTAPFETLLREVDRTLKTTRNAQLVRQSLSLRFYRAREQPEARVLYVAAIDPTVPGANYSFSHILTAGSGMEWERLPSNIRDQLARGDAALSSANQIMLRRVTAAFTPPGLASPLSAAAPDAAPRLTLKDRAAMLLMPVKPERVAAFDRFVSQLDARLRTTNDPMLARQARGLAVYKSVGEGAGNTMYVFLIDPVASYTADYYPYGLLERAMRPEERNTPAVRELWAGLADAVAGAMNIVNLTAVDSGQLRTEVVLPPRPEPPPPPPNAIRVGGAIKAPTKLKNVEPVYPAIAQSARVTGLVIIEATIDPQGRVSDARILRSVPLLDQAALDAVRQWEFTPTLLNGVSVPVIMTVTVTFSLK